MSEQAGGCDMGQAIGCGVGSVLVTLGLLVGPALATAPSRTTPAYVRAALANPARGDMREVDARRRTEAVIAFSGIKPGDKVAELIPGQGYFSKIFAKIVGPHGRVYMVWPNEYAKVAHPDPEVDRELAQKPEYSNITVLAQPAARFSTPEPVDLVFTAQNYHDYPDKFMGSVDPVAFDRAVFRALKPGGVFLVVDHVAEAGSGMRDTDTLHRIDPATVKAQVTSVGFRFDGESQALRNPSDDHRRRVFDPQVRGHTDQFIFRFRKPG